MAENLSKTFVMNIDWCAIKEKLNMAGESDPLKKKQRGGLLGVQTKKI